MTWLTPLLAGVAAAIAIPSLVVLYFLKLRRRDVEVSTTLLWKKAIQDLQANAPFQRLRRNILLLLQLLALAAILLALGQPELQTGAPPGQRSVLLIDRSASMSALDEADESSGAQARTRLDKAKLEATRFVDAMREPGLFNAGRRDEAMVIAFDAGAEVVEAFTADKARLRAAIDAIEPSHGPSSLDEAARLAGAYAMPFLDEERGLVSPPGAPIYLWSDGRLADAASIRINPETPLTYRAVGGPETTNLAVTSFRAQRAFDRSERVSVFVGVQSTSAEARSVDVEFAVDGLVSAIRTVNLPGAQAESAGGSGAATSGVVFELDRTEGALMRVRLLTTDALDVDNQAWLVLPPARRLAVLYVAARPSLLRDAVEAQTVSRIVAATPEQYGRLVREGRDGEFDVVVLDGWAPEGPPPPGRFLVFGAAPKLQGLSTGAAAAEGARIVIDWSREHPALRAVSLENLFISNGLSLEVGEGAKALAQSDKGPIIVEAAEGPSRAIVVGFDVMDTNWVWDHNLVLFVGSAIHHLGAESAASAQPGAQPGGTLTARLPSGAANVELTLPGGGSARLAPSADGVVNYGPLRRAGAYRLRWLGAAGPGDATVDGRAQRVVVANLFDGAESNIASRETLELASRTVASAEGGAAPAQSTRRLWPWLLLACLGVVMLEWFVYNRKMHV